MGDPMTPEQVTEVRSVLAAMGGPWVVSDCEGRLQVWRLSAVRDIERDEAGEVVNFRTPGHWQAADLVAEWDLNCWDEGEDSGDDARRDNAFFMAAAPDIITGLLAERDQLQGALRRRVGRSTTPNREVVGADGRKSTVIKVKRGCNGCGGQLGDATEEETLAAMYGHGLPDVRAECPTCTPAEQPDLSTLFGDLHSLLAEHRDSAMTDNELTDAVVAKVHAVLTGGETR